MSDNYEKAGTTRERGFRHDGSTLLPPAVQWLRLVEVKGDDGVWSAPCRPRDLEWSCNIDTPIRFWRPAPLTISNYRPKEWIEWHGGACPVPGDTIVDLRFFGYDSLRAPPYLRHHEMWDQRADSARWDRIEQMYGRHPCDISHYRVVRWTQ